MLFLAGVSKPAQAGDVPDEIWWGEARLRHLGQGAGDLAGEGGAIDGDWAIIGVPGRNTPLGNGSGAVNFFERGSTSWSDLGLVFPNGLGAGDRLGGAVAIDYPYAIAGATNISVSGDIVGGAYIFEHFDNQWVPFQVLPPVLATAEAMGSSVAIFGDRVAIADFATNSLTGRVHVYRRVGLSNWTLEGTLVPSDATPDDVIGQRWSVALGPNLLVMGGNGHEAAGNFAGAAWVFQFDGTNWVETQKLLPVSFGGGSLNFARFGGSLDIDGTRLVVGSSQSTAGTTAGFGLIYAYLFDGSNFQFEQFITNETAGTFIGRQVRVSGDRIISDPGVNGGDPTLVFERDAGLWSQVSIIDGSTPNSDLFNLNPPFSNSGQIDISGDRILIGSKNDDQNRGSSHVFDWRVNTQAQLLISPPSPVTLGQQVTLTAQITASQPVSGGFASIYDVDGGGFLCPSLPVNGSGQASCNFAFGVARTWNLAVVYSSQNTYASSFSLTVPLEVLPNETQTVITSNTPNPSTQWEPVLVEISVNESAPRTSGTQGGDPPQVPTGTVVVSDGVDECSVFLSSGDAGTGSCTLFPTTPGLRQLVATYSGDSVFGSSSSPPVNQQVDPGEPLDITALPATFTVGNSTDLFVTGGTGLFDLEISEGESVCELNGTQVTGLIAGTCVATASLQFDERGTSITASVELRVTSFSGADIDIAIAPVDIPPRSASLRGCDDIQFDITVTNRGPETASEVRLQAPVPSGLEGPLNWSCTVDGGDCSPNAGADSVDADFVLTVGDSAVINYQGCAVPGATWVVFEAEASLPDGTTLLFPGTAAEQLFFPLNGDGIFRDRLR
ncbi:MAG: Ig-like domain repeat protein [Pseudomonadota bacterium]